MIEYLLPYKTTIGSFTTLKVALGINVVVNTIIGMTTIHFGNSSLDLNYNLMDPGTLDTSPFPLIFKPAELIVLNLFNIPCQSTIGVAWYWSLAPQ